MTIFPCLPTLAAASMMPLWIIVVYFVALIALGLVSNVFFRGTAADYFVVSRSIGSFVLLMSIFGATMTGFALVGSTGEAFARGVGVYGLLASSSGLMHSAVFFIIGIRLWAIGKRYGYVTQCAYFRDRFDSTALSYMLFFTLVVLLIPYLLVGIIASGKFIQATTAGMFPGAFPLPHLPNGHPHPLSGGVPPWIGSAIVCGVVLFYIYFGGFRSAVWANTFQTAIFMIAGVVAFYMVSQKLGGLHAATQKLLDSPYAERAARGNQIGQLEFLSYCLVPLSVGMFPHLFQHWLTAKSARSFRLTVVMHPIFIAIVWVPCILIGVWAAGIPNIIPHNANVNTILGMMIRKLVDSPLLLGLVGAGVLAAIMSSLDSQFMCLGTMFTQDIVAHAIGKHRSLGDRQRIWLSRMFILGIVVVTYFISIAMMSNPKRTESVFVLGVWTFSGFAALFPLVFAAVYWKRATRAGAIACLLVTAATWIFFFCRDVLAVKPAGQESDSLVLGLMPVVFIFAASAVTLIVVSLLTPRLPTATIDKFFDPKAHP